MDDVQHIAKAIYEKLPEDKKKPVQDYFESMDRNKDGKIVASEFFHFFENASTSRYHGRSYGWLLKLFQDLDRNGDGSLDFNEFITLFYLLIFGVCCAGCEVILNGKDYLTCAHCSNKETSSSFDLCRACYTRKNFTHTHEDWVVPVFQERASMLKNNELQDVAIRACVKFVISIAGKLAIHHFGAMGVAAAAAGPGACVEQAGKVIDKACDIVDDVVDNVVDKARHVVDKANDIVDNVFDNVVDKARHVVDKANDIVDDVVDNVVDKARDVVDKARDIVDVVDIVVDNAQDIADMTSDFVDVAGNIADAVANNVEIVSFVLDAMCSLM